MDIAGRIAQRLGIGGPDSRAHLDAQEREREEREREERILRRDFLAAAERDCEHGCGCAPDDTDCLWVDIHRQEQQRAAERVADIASAKRRALEAGARAALRHPSRDVRLRNRLGI